MYPYAKRSRDVISTCPAYTRSALHRRVNRKFRALERGANKDVALLRHGMGTQRFRHGLYIAVTKRFRYGYGTFAVRLRCSTVKCTVRLRHGCVTVTARLRYGTVRYSYCMYSTLRYERFVLFGQCCCCSVTFDRVGGAGRQLVCRLYGLRFAAILVRFSGVFLLRLAPIV